MENGSSRGFAVVIVEHSAQFVATADAAHLEEARRRLPGRGRSFPRRPPTDPYVTNSVIRFVSNGPFGPRTCSFPAAGDMTVAAHPGADSRTRTLSQSEPVS